MNKMQLLALVAFLSLMGYIVHESENTKRTKIAADAELGHYICVSVPDFNGGDPE